MALMISTSANYHWVKKISAHTNGGGVLALTFHGDRGAHDSQFNQAEISVFTDDVALTERLIKAINGAATSETVAASETHECERCDSTTANPENEYGEFICESCEQNAAESAYERHCEDFHDGGCTRFNSPRDQQIEAMKLK